MGLRMAGRKARGPQTMERERARRVDPLNVHPRARSMGFAHSLLRPGEVGAVFWRRERGKSGVPRGSQYGLRP